MYKLIFLLSFLVVIICWVLDPLISFIGSCIGLLITSISFLSVGKIEGEISDY